jgi:hypothetical protein
VKSQYLVIGGVVIAVAVVLYFLWQSQQTSAANLAAQAAANYSGGPNLPSGSSSIIGGVTSSLSGLLSDIGSGGDIGSLSEAFTSGTNSNAPGLEDDSYDDSGSYTD